MTEKISNIEYSLGSSDVGYMLYLSLLLVEGQLKEYIADKNKRGSEQNIQTDNLVYKVLQGKILMILIKDLKKYPEDIHPLIPEQLERLTTKYYQIGL